MIEFEGCLDEARFAGEGSAISAEFEGLAEDAKGVVIGVKSS